MSLAQSTADQVRGSVMPSTVMGPLVPTSTTSVVSTVPTSGCDRKPAARTSPTTTPTPTPATSPVIGPRPWMRFCRVSPSPGIGTCAFSASFSTVCSGVELVGRPRTVMSRYVTALSAVLPAAPAAAPRRAQPATLMPRRPLPIVPSGVRFAIRPVYPRRTAGYSQLSAAPGGTATRPRAARSARRSPGAAPRSRGWTASAATAAPLAVRGLPARPSPQDQPACERRHEQDGDDRLQGRVGRAPGQFGPGRPGLGSAHAGQHLLLRRGLRGPPRRPAAQVGHQPVVHRIDGEDVQGGPPTTSRSASRPEITAWAPRAWSGVVPGAAARRG